MAFDHKRHNDYLRRQSRIARGLRGAAARAEAADRQARQALGDRYVEAAGTKRPA